MPVTIYKLPKDRRRLPPELYQRCCQIVLSELTDRENFFLEVVQVDSLTGGITVSYRKWVAELHEAHFHGNVNGTATPRRRRAAEDIPF